MRVLIVPTHPFVGVDIAGKSCLGRMIAAVDHLGDAFVVESPAEADLTQIRGEQLWIHGLFPLLDAAFVDDLIKRGRQTKGLALVAQDHPELGLLYLPDGDAPHPDFVTATAAIQSINTDLHAFTQAADFPVFTRRAFAAQARRAMAAGALIHDPALVWIGPEVVLKPGAVLEPNVTLSGHCHIGTGVRISQGCVLRDVTVAHGAVIKPYSVLESANVGLDSAVGPFAHLRPGTHLGSRVKVGNFVETKKVTMGDDSKASHLSYLGDAQIGADCNIGAGTITCNYDGYNKHKTQLGDRVFIGSDSQLVAPVSLGDGAYVAAGSTIVDDVPAEALAVARGRQVVKPQRAVELRQRAKALKAQQS